MTRKASRIPPHLRHPLWDTHLVPGISQLARRPTKSIPKALKPDPLQFVTTSILLGIATKTRVRTLNFIRRTRNVYEEYHRARRAYSAFFLAEDNTQRYFDALHHFEVCLASAYQGHELLFGGLGAAFLEAD
jgi:hypothetical protein